MKIALQALLLLLLSSTTYSQILFEEDFESNSIPANWTSSTLSTDGGWKAGSSATLSSDAFGIQSNGSNFFVGTNDDACNCNKSQEILITPEIDLTSVSNALVTFDLYFWNRVYQTIAESASIEITTDQGANWNLLDNFEGNANWSARSIDISQYVGNNIQLRFTYNDGGGWLYGCAIDNVIVFVPNAFDAEVVSFNLKEFAKVGDEVPIAIDIFNKGLNTITDLEIAYSVNGEEKDSEVISGLNLNSFTNETVSFTNSWMPEQTGTNNVEVTVLSINGVADEDVSNNTFSTAIEIFENVVVPNKIDEYLGTNPNIIEVGNSTHGLDKPTDLDFYPILALNELWVINQRFEGIGGSTVTYQNPGKSDQTQQAKVDGNSWHFMSLPTGIAFSENGNFANSPGVMDANHGGGTFTGPTLWDSDPAVYAQPSGGNGSHIDMLHGSPFSMGIAAERDNVFWVFDSHNGMPVRYDFVDDHGPGNDFHADGIVRRYSEISIKRDGDVPSHMVLDAEKKWMYMVDNGNDRVVRININSGTNSIALALINEQLAEHSEMTGVEFETIISAGLDRPCGIEIIEDRLLVGDYSTGHIVVYDISDNFNELGRIVLGETGLTGIKIGPEGYIWCTNSILNKLYRVEPGSTSSVNDPELLASLNLYPNPTSDYLTIDMNNERVAANAAYSIYDMSGKNLISGLLENRNATISTLGLSNGIYYIKINSGSELLTKEFVVVHD